MTATGSFAIRLSEGLRDVRQHYQGRGGQRRARRIAFLLFISVVAIGIYVWIGPTEVAQLLLSFVDMARARPFIFGSALFLVWTALFLTAAPLGSVTVMTAGFVFGPSFGFLQAASQLASSVLLYRLLPEPKDDIFAASRTLRLVRDQPVLFVGAVRLVPVLPSAISVIAYRELGITMRHMIVGTLLVGWMRPVSLAWVGSRIPDIQALIERLT
jgi:uncharacterized membrane protein YdjX (TVP38/TMEM64 family)